MGYNIVELESQNHGQDWPLIVTAIVCPTCGAEKGQGCVSIGTREGPAATSPFINVGTKRNDWHAARKQAAAHAWYTRHETASQPQEIAGNGEQGEPATAQPQVAHETPGESSTGGKEVADSAAPALQGDARNASAGAAEPEE